jgi:2-polyprenyl-3-methyl-5-hydroxy-6-metoxy-1,4-benzoquinol methylase
VSGELRIDRREWDDLARHDAMWAVCSQKHGWDPDEFFASGEEEIAGLVDWLQERRLLQAHRRALDFGCGVGRLSRALGARFAEVTGVDISAEMISRAQRLNSDCEGCRFLLNVRGDLAEFTGPYDLVVSLIALQHVGSSDAIRAYIRDFVRLAMPGGVIAFQVPATVSRRVRWHPLRVLNRALRRVPRLPRTVWEPLTPWSMRLTALPADAVRAELDAAGARLVHSFDDKRTGSPHVTSRMYIATCARG